MSKPVRGVFILFQGLLCYIGCRSIGKAPVSNPPGFGTRRARIPLHSVPAVKSARRPQRRGRTRRRIDPHPWTEDEGGVEIRPPARGGQGVQRLVPQRPQGVVQHRRLPRPTRPGHGVSSRATRPASSSRPRPSTSIQSCPLGRPRRTGVGVRPWGSHRPGRRLITSRHAGEGPWSFWKERV